MYVKIHLICVFKSQPILSKPGRRHKPAKVVGLKGQKSLNLTTSGDKAKITVLACVSATGYVMPPMVIFDRNGLGQNLPRGKSQVLSMDYLGRDGLKVSSLSNGLKAIFCDMPHLRDLRSSCWTDIHHITSLQLCIRQQQVK